MVGGVGYDNTLGLAHQADVPLVARKDDPVSSFEHLDREGNPLPHGYTIWEGRKPTIYLHLHFPLERRLELNLSDGLYTALGTAWRDIFSPQADNEQMVKLLKGTDALSGRSGDPYVKNKPVSSEEAKETKQGEEKEEEEPAKQPIFGAPEAAEGLFGTKLPAKSFSPYRLNNFSGELIEVQAYVDPHLPDESSPVLQVKDGLTVPFSYGGGWYSDSASQDERRRLLVRFPECGGSIQGIQVDKVGYWEKKMAFRQAGSGSSSAGPQRITSIRWSVELRDGCKVVTLSSAAQVRKSDNSCISWLSLTRTSVQVLNATRGPLEVAVVRRVESRHILNSFGIASPGSKLPLPMKLFPVTALQVSAV